MLVFGRRARGERIDYGLIHDQWRIRIDDRLAWADALFGEGDDLVGALRHPAALDNAGASALLVHAGPERGQAPRSRARPAGRDQRAGALRGHLRERHPAGALAGGRIPSTSGPSFARVWTALRAAARNLSPALPTFWHH